MITNYPTLKTKTFKSNAYRYFNDLPLKKRNARRKIREKKLIIN